ncbi:hypothetical protein ACHAXS_004025 [Conticribra weissflogii]
MNSWLKFSALPSFESHGGRLEPFDDGHIPETYRFSPSVCGQAHRDTGNELDASTPRILIYDCCRSAKKSSVHIYDGILNAHHARMLYEVTTTRANFHGKIASDRDEHDIRINKPLVIEGESPWGTYVTVKDALKWIELNKHINEVETRSGSKMGGGPGDTTPTAPEESNYHQYLSVWKRKFCKWRDLKSKQFQSLHTHSGLEEKKEEPRKIVAEQIIDSENEISIDNLREDMDEIRHVLAVEAVAIFFIQTIPSMPGTTAVSSESQTDENDDTKETLYTLSELLEGVHGVAVWALASNPGDSVQYHIDYAELLRYEYNVTVPPLWAGTAQCSLLWNDLSMAKSNGSNIHGPPHQHNHSRRDNENIMVGGEFCVNLRGLDHYSEHGYKGNLSGDPMGGYDSPTTKSCDGNIHFDQSTHWVTIPYSFNRGIVHRGDLPHLSTPIQHIGTCNSALKGDGSSLSRVIVGFNAFGHDFGALIEKAPEHSKRFRRKVKLYRATMNSCARDIECASAEGETITKIESSSRLPKSLQMKDRLDFAQIKRNKSLSKLLVLAKREKVKDDLRRNQQLLTQRIWKKLLQNYRQNESPIKVSDLVQEFGSQNDDKICEWPKSVDVHVHLHHILLAGKRAISDKHNLNNDKEKSFIPFTSNCYCDNDGLAGDPGVVFFLSTENSLDVEIEHNQLVPLSTIVIAFPIGKS